MPEQLQLMIQNYPPSKAIEFLKNKNIPFQLFIHSKKINSLQDAAEQRGQSVDQVLRSILFRSKDHQFYLVVTTGSQQINWKKLRNFLGINRTTLATENEVISETGFQLGTVNPFGLKPEIAIFINEPCLNQNIVSLGSGIKGTAIIIKIQNLIKALPKAIIENFSE
jgi:Ala-tRNA(Pro) deacylase